MDKCSFDRFNGMYNPMNGSVWFFGKCFNSIMEVIKIVEDVPKEYDSYIDIRGLTCFIRTSTGQIWYNHKLYKDVHKAYKALDHMLTHGSGKTRISRHKSSNNLEFLSLTECD